MVVANGIRLVTQLWPLNPLLASLIAPKVRSKIKGELWGECHSVTTILQNMRVWRPQFVGCCTVNKNHSRMIRSHHSSEAIHHLFWGLLGFKAGYPRWAPTSAGEVICESSAPPTYLAGPCTFVVHPHLHHQHSIHCGKEVFKHQQPMEGDVTVSACRLMLVEIAKAKAPTDLEHP